MKKQIKTKVFTGFLKNVEAAMNKWFAENYKTIEFVFSTSTSYTQEITTTVFYTGDETETIKRRLEEADQRAIAEQLALSEGNTEENDEG